MTTLAKFDELVGEAFVNAMRLHLDSIMLSKNGSYASANLLAMQASQEITKALALEHLLSQTLKDGTTVHDPVMNRALTDIFTSHRTLERQVARTINQFSRQPEYKDLAALLGKVADQVCLLESDRLTYVGLTKKDRKINLDGKKVIPRLNGRKEKTHRSITINHDFLTVYISGFVYGAYGVVSDSMAWEMSLENLRILQLEWFQVGRKARQLQRGYETMLHSETSTVPAADKMAYSADENSFYEEQTIPTSL